MLASPATKAKAQAARYAGDQARDKGRWTDAAQAYQVFLDVYVNHAGIWIQRGNMLKEALDYAGAEQAYRRALLLSPREAEVHLQLGHLRKRQGQLVLAAGHYSRAFHLDPKSPAAAELSSTEIARHLGGVPERDGGKAMLALFEPLQRRTRGMSITAAHGIALEKDGDALTASFGDHDPWMEMRLDTGAERFGELTFDVDWVSGDDSELGEDSRLSQVYVDYGKGYSEERVINVARPENGINRILIAGPSTIRSIRWDPDVKPGSVKLKSIAYRAIDTREEIEAWIAAAPYDPLHGRVGDPDLDDFLEQPEIDAAMARSIQDRLPTGFDRSFAYESWREIFIDPAPEDYERMAQMEADFAIRPKFSFVMPVYNPPVELLAECIDSMLSQNYVDFEICIADDCSPNSEIGDMLRRYESEYSDRIKIAYRPRNGHISAASNSALALATGDFVVLVDHDDLVPQYALWVIAHYINLHPHAKILFSDEDKVTPEGLHFSPYFKSEYNEFLMYGHNMVSHIGVYSTQLLREIGGFRLGYEGSQDYDLFLRAYEKIAREQVLHIPHVLYHWRAIPGSTAVSADQKGYAIYAAQAAINGYMERNGLPMRSVDGFAPGCTGIKLTREITASVSIIVPTRNGLDILKPCIESIQATKPVDCEIIVVDNGSDDPDALAYFEQLKEDGVRVLAYPHAFNFSAINNFAAEHATGEILCFLNNDTEVVARNWLDRARALLALPGIGMVGARLLFPDLTVQHFGIALGVGGHRIAGTPHAGYDAIAPGYFGKSRLIQEFSAVTAACMFVRRADFMALGGFDVELQIAYNDIDLCLRLRRDLNQRIVCDPEIELIHKESRSRGSDKKGERAERLDREARMMRERWAETLDHDPYYSPNLSLERVDFALAYPPRVPMPWK